MSGALDLRRPVACAVTHAWRRATGSEQALIECLFWHAAQLGYFPHSCDTGSGPGWQDVSGVDETAALIDSVADSVVLFRGPDGGRFWVWFSLGTGGDGIESHSFKPVAAQVVSAAGQSAGVIL